MGKIYLEVCITKYPLPSMEIGFPFLDSMETEDRIIPNFV
jgi:hypothetical protein